MRKCVCCKKELPESEFWRVRKDSPELRTSCKSCTMKASRKWQKNNLRRKREHSRRSSRRIRAEIGYPPLSREERARVNEWAIRYYYGHKDQYAARDYTQEAIKRGKKLIAGKLNRHRRQGRVLFVPERCEICGKIDKLTPHHYIGYKKENWLDVKFVCQQCHSDIHIEINFVKTVDPKCENPYYEGFRIFCMNRAAQNNLTLTKAVEKEA